MKPLAALFFVVSVPTVLVVSAPSARVRYVPASDAEVAALFSEAERSGAVVRCVAADTPSGCRQDDVSAPSAGKARPSAPKARRGRGR